MTDLSNSTDTELTRLQQEIVAEQKRRKDISALQQDAKVASEQIVLATNSLESYGVGSRFELLRGLMPEDFIDWLALGGGAQRTAWKQPTDSSNTYKTGDVVIYQGQSYRSLISQNSFSPVEDPASWQAI